MPDPDSELESLADFQSTTSNYRRQHPFNASGLTTQTKKERAQRNFAQALAMAAASTFQKQDINQTMEVVTLEEIKEIRERDETLQSLNGTRFDDDQVIEEMDEMMIPTEGVETVGVNSFKIDNKEEDDDASDELNDSCDEGVCDVVPEQKVARSLRKTPSLRVLPTLSTPGQKINETQITKNSTEKPLQRQQETLQKIK